MTEQLAQQITEPAPAYPGADPETDRQPESTTAAAPQQQDSLFDADLDADLQQQWSDVQSRFVDDPRAAVQQADALVADVVRTLVDSFASRRAALEQEWARDEQPSTEELRVLFQRYRSFFTRLLSA